MNNNLLKPLLKFFNRHGRQSILHLTMIGMIATFILDFAASFLKLPVSLFELFYFDPDLILGGQVWRLFTFPFLNRPGTSLMSIIWFAFSMLIYNIVITTLETKVGKARANLFAVLCWLTLALYGLVARSYVDFGSVLLAITALAGFYNPDFTIYFYFFIPVRGIVLGILGLALMVYTGLVGGAYEYLLILGLVILLNFEAVSGFFTSRSRKQTFARKVKAVQAEKTARHRCEVCGRTEKDVPDMLFRYCSQCEGSFEYCEDHIQNHEHRSNIVDLDAKRSSQGTGK